MARLFSFKNQLLKVIEWTDDSSDTLVYRYSVPDRYEIMDGSQLTVRESQMAIFVAEGKVADVFGPGRYKLDTKNLPFLTTLFNWKYAFESKYTGEVYYVNTKQFAGLKWGTTNPIMMRDQDFGMIRLRGYGQFAFKAEDPKKLMCELTGTKKLFTTSEIVDQLKRAIISRISEAIAASNVAALDLATCYDRLGDLALDMAQEDFDQFGLCLTSLHIENLSLPEEVEAKMDTRTSMGVLGDLNKYTQYAAAEALGDAAKNSGGLAGAGIGIGAGVGFGNMFAGAMSGAFNPAAPAAPAAPTAPGGAVCAKCGAALRSGAKFCPDCGTPTTATAGNTCPSCHATVKAGAKFCPECGKKLGASICTNCGAKLADGAKFCPNCGQKV